MRRELRVCLLALFVLRPGLAWSDGIENGGFEVIEGWLVERGAGGGGPPRRPRGCRPPPKARRAPGPRGSRIGRTIAAPEREAPPRGRLAHATFACGSDAAEPYC